MSGAKFVLYKQVPVEDKTEPKTLYYKWNSTTKKIVWTEKFEDATEVEADNKYETQEFKGLDDGTYFLQETVAPDGYGKLAKDIQVDITCSDNQFTVKVDCKEIKANQYKYYTVDIANTKGSPMPVTGGAGTIALVVGGLILFGATAIVLVTKKRMYNAG